MIHFVVHDENDSVGVVVVEGVKAGDSLNGWIMDQDKEIAFNAGSHRELVRLSYQDFERLVQPKTLSFAKPELIAR